MLFWIDCGVTFVVVFLCCSLEFEYIVLEFCCLFARVFVFDLWVFGLVLGCALIDCCFVLLFMWVCDFIGLYYGFYLFIGMKGAV